MRENPDRSTGGGDDGNRIRISNVLSALSRALDITEGQPPGHAVRNAVIGMRLANAIGLEADERSDLFYALLLKDLGCSSNAARFCYLFGTDDQVAKRDLKLTDWTTPLGAASFAARNAARGGSLLERARQLYRVGTEGSGSSRELIEIRCERGADIARTLGFSEATADSIHDLDEHWDGGGYPAGKKETEIPLLARILCLAQSMEVFASEGGVDAAYRMAQERKATWFDPELVDAATTFKDDKAFWASVRGADLERALEPWEPEDRVLLATEERIDRIARAFAQIVDAKSPWTYRHSEKVTEVAVRVARHMGLDPEQVKELRRASLLHDLGKLGISNLILDKTGRLTDQEMARMQKHPEYSFQILRRVAPFEETAKLARDHHERLDRGGYCRGIGEEDLCRELRVLTAADVFEALTAERPYRDARTPDEALEIMAKETGSHFCPEAFQALSEVIRRDGPPQ